MFACGTSGMTLLVDARTNPRPRPANRNERSTLARTSATDPCGSVDVTDTQPQIDSKRPA